METIRTLIQRFKDGSIKEMWNEWKWIYHYARNYKKEILFYIIIGMFSTILGLIGSLASRDLIDTVTGHITSNITFIGTVIVSMAIFKLLFGAFCSRISIKINIRIQNDIQADIFDKIIHVNWSELSKYHSGDLLNRFGGDVSTVAGSVIGWFPSLINSLFSLFCSFCLIMYFDPIMALIALMNAPVMLLASNFLMDRMRQHSKEVKKMSSEMLSFQEESFHNIDSIKSFNLADIFSNRLIGFQKRFAKLSLDYNYFSIKTNICLSLLGMIVQYSCFGWGVYRLWTGYITYGTMTIFLGLARSLSANFNAVISVISSTVSSTTSAGRIMEIINLDKEAVDEKELKELLELEEFKLEMHDVDFSYVADKPVLQNVQFEALPGQIVGLVGPSGEGKTTMIRLLLGLTKPDSGTSLLVSKENKTYTLDACTRNLFAYVPQGNTIFSGTIRENLKMVKQDATEEEMIEALKLACAYDFVFAKPDGLDSELGERGRGLSEGQAQRIAIARALLRDAPVLLLDEATSALDVNTERQILKHIMANDSHRICIVTSHRPSVLNLCHQVYEIKNKHLKTLTNLEVENLINDF